MIEMVETTDDEFPVNPNIRTYVDCRFPKKKNGKLLDVGTCKVPRGQTLTLDQYKKQQTEGVQIASRC